MFLVYSALAILKIPVELLSFPASFLGTQMKKFHCRTFRKLLKRFCCGRFAYLIRAVSTDDFSVEDPYVVIEEIA